MLANDGTYTAFYQPSLDGYYNISVRLESTNVNSPSSLMLSALNPGDSLRYAMPIDQCNKDYKTNLNFYRIYAITFIYS